MAINTAPPEDDGAGQVPELEVTRRLSRDLRRAASTLTPSEVRYLVDYYYLMQEDRIRAKNQVRALGTSGEPHAVVLWLADNTALLERSIKNVMDLYTDANLVGSWAKSVVGIGPIISAGLLAHIDLEPWRCAQCPRPKDCCEQTPCTPGRCGRQRIVTVGGIWRFAGLDPTSVWGKGQKRPWNARLKVLCWKIGESFVKQSGRDGDVYGHLWRERKEREEALNVGGHYAEQAAHLLATKKFDKDKVAAKCYRDGRLPPGHVHARAKRWAVKLFLAHWFTVAYRHRFGSLPPRPYVLEQLGHAHEIQVPNWPF